MNKPTTTKESKMTTAAATIQDGIEVSYPSQAIKADTKSSIGYAEYGFWVASTQFSQGTLEELERVINLKLDDSIAAAGDYYSEEDIKTLRPLWLANEWRNVANEFPAFVKVRR
jgi:hypothetical protein